MTGSMPDSGLGPFLMLRLRQARHQLAELRGEGWIKVVSIAASCGFVAIFAFAVALAGFQFLGRQKLPLGGDIVGLLLDMFFFALSGLLVFSGGLVLYGSLYDSQESAFLLSKPVPDDRVYAHQFIGSLAVSSAAFVLLAMPLLLAYGLSVRASPLYYFLLIPCFVFFPLAPASVGGIICLGLVRWIPNRRKEALAALIVILVIVGLAWLGSGLYRLRPGATSSDDEALNEVLGHVQFASSQLLPSHWMGRGLRHAARGELEPALRHLAMMASVGTATFCLSAWIARQWYRIGLDRLSQRGRVEFRQRFVWMDRLPGFVPGIGEAERALLLKDFRTFRRDPRQWGQMLVFLVLLGFYFSSLRRMFPGEIGWVFRNGISLMNLMVIGMLLCASCGRFIFPLISLEGKRVWLLGLTPLPRSAWLRGKVAFSLMLCLLFSLPLLLYSDMSLRMPVELIVLHQVAAIGLSMGLSSLAAGLGAVWPNFREKDPSKIAVGYGGTLSLVIGLVFLLALVGTVALPWHVIAGFTNNQFPLWGWLVVLPGLASGLVLSFLAVTVPIRLGNINLDRQEF